MRVAGFMDLALLAAAGAVGTLARFGVYQLCDRPGLKGLPAGTLIVNVAGCLVFGLVLGVIPGDSRLSAQAKWLILTGFLGAFTTFSAFAFETGRSIAQGQYVAAAVNIAANNVLGIAAFMLGWWLSGVLVTARGPM
ncbi:MAG: fluoride efflux transporter CrcB [Phycisphaerales bacterium]|nr:fluoride efflux transporter CrcB [Phycisphaerales bacterium]